MRQVSLDIETSGLDPRGKSRIIELGATEFIDGQPSGRQLHYYFNPGAALAPGVEQLIKLSDKFLAQQPTFADNAQVIHEFLSGAELVLFHGKFDTSFLEAEFALAGLPIIDLKNHVDVHEMGMELFIGRRCTIDWISRQIGLDVPTGNALDVAKHIMMLYQRIGAERAG